MRIAIVDDLAPERDWLQGQLERQLRRRNLAGTILEYDTGEAFLKAAAAKPFDVAFLDIYMPGIGGMETARRLRRSDKGCLLIFITTSRDHALEGFQVRATDYLVKPFPESEIDRLMEELLLRLPRPEKYMTLKVEGADVRLNYESLVYAEHFAHVIYVHTTAGKTLATRMPFKAFLAPLKEEPRFFVCGRGTVANLEHAVNFAEGAFCMEDGSRVPVSQDLRKEAKQAFMEYLLQRGPGI